VNEILKVLPLTVVMIAGPQFISAVFLATSETWKKDSLAFCAGAALSISLVIGAGYLLGSGAGGGADPSDTVDWIVLALLAFAGFHTFQTRTNTEPPKWMGKLQSASPSFSFKLGFLLLGVFPSDLVTSIGVGSYLANHNHSYAESLIFVALTVFLLAIPALLLLVLGERGKALLPKIRQWMNDNSWIIGEFVIVLFIVLVGKDLV
jgi:cytochrome c biogenesis protein CcdA